MPQPLPIVLPGQQALAKVLGLGPLCDLIGASPYSGPAMMPVSMGLFYHIIVSYARRRMVLRGDLCPVGNRASHC